MLTLGRKQNESIMIGDNIKLTVTRVDRSGHVRISIDAPREIAIYREELYREIQNQKGKQAAAA